MTPKKQHELYEIAYNLFIENNSIKFNDVVEHLMQTYDINEAMARNITSRAEREALAHEDEY